MTYVKLGNFRQRSFEICVFKSKTVLLLLLLLLTTVAAAAAATTTATTITTTENIHTGCKAGNIDLPKHLSKEKSNMSQYNPFCFENEFRLDLF